MQKTHVTITAGEWYCTVSTSLLFTDLRMLSVAQVGYIDDPRGPIGLAGIVVLALTAILILEVLDFADALKSRK